MPIASNLTQETNFRALFVGPKHSGKTVAACSWMSENSKKRVKVLDADGRIRGLLGAPWIDRERIDYDPFPPRIATGKTFFERVNNDLEVLFLEVSNNRSPYETYVCDSATAFCKNLIIDAIPLTHIKKEGFKDQQVGRHIGVMEMAGPSDYGFESTGTDAYFSFLRSLPLNIIVTAHVIDKFDKPLKEDGVTKDPYAESIVVGEKLSLRDKIAANISIYFDHIFRFDRRMVGGQERFYVQYISNIACTSFPGLPVREQDITGKDFRKFTLGLLSSANGKEVVSKLT